MKVLVLTKITDYFKKMIEKYSKIYNIKFYTKNEIDKVLKEVDAVIGASLSEKQIIEAKNLKVIFIPWTGADKLPWEIIKQRKIIVSNSHGNGKIVAERAIALALSLLGRIVEYHKDLEKGVWHGFTVGFKEKDYWFSLQNKKVAILGTGVIGRHLAKLLKGFDVEIKGYRKHVENVDGFDFVTNSLDEVLKDVNIVFLTLPLTHETYHIIDKEVFNKMKNKFLINVGRGELIDEKALYEALKEGILLGFASDVWYEYPDEEINSVLPSRYPIHTFRNVVISPHVGGFTIEGQRGRIDELFENIVSYVETGKPRSIVDPEKMY
ncbi:MAG: hydroxyacid dehydrogenase [Thermosipho sp. (in: Bacteria)]|nr:hydroxyacid dehydrogenase [Thermosipho sp. (in: thermotogales)]